MISYDHLEAAGNPIIPPDAPFDGHRFERFAELARASKAHGALVTGQVSHPGRQVAQNIQPDPVSASDVQLEGDVMGMRFAKPHAASVDEIQDIVRDLLTPPSTCIKLDMMASSFTEPMVICWRNS